jgi:membrane associated rhomboid family serine protease
VSTAPGSSANFCYRHPDRQSYILCQRCGRTICPQCQTQAAVGVHCPECVREGRASMPRTRVNLLARFRGADQPVVTWSLIALNVLLYVLQRVPGSPVTNALLFVAQFPWVESEPWRMITYAFVHSPGSLLHIGLNMLSLFLFGPLLERSIGRARFIALYLVSAFGGAVAVLLLVPGGSVVGASGAVFGLLGAFFVIQRRLGGNTVQLMVVIGLNLLVGFLPGTNISWQAHVGGLLAGGAVAFVYVRTRRADQRTTQIVMIALVIAVLVAISAARIIIAALA